MPAIQAQQIEAPKEDSTAKIEKKPETMPSSEPQTLEDLQKEAKQQNLEELKQETKQISDQKLISEKEAGEGKKESEKEKTPSSVYGREGKEEVGKLLQLVIFNLGKEEYGLMITDVKEILKTEKITFVPNAPEFIKGIINVRGQIVVIVDLEKKFLIQKEGKGLGEHLVLTEQDGSTYGLMVDQVTEVLRVPEKSIQEAPKLIAEKISADYLKGVATIQNRLIILLDLAKILSEGELAKAGAKIGELHVKPEEVAGAEKEKTDEEEKLGAKKEEIKEVESEKEFKPEEELPTKKELEKSFGGEAEKLPRPKLDKEKVEAIKTRAKEMEKGIKKTKHLNKHKTKESDSETGSKT